MNNQNNYDCISKVKNGIIIRYIVTVIAFYLLSINSKDDDKRIYLILPILLLVLDNVDNIFTFNYERNICTKTFYYQSNDKVCDLISYLLLFYFFELDNIALGFTLYRMIGVVLYNITKNGIWLMLFFDCVKEYLLYLFLFGKFEIKKGSKLKPLPPNWKILSIFILFKMGVEFHYHVKKLA